MVDTFFSFFGRTHSTRSPLLIYMHLHEYYTALQGGQMLWYPLFRFMALRFFSVNKCPPIIPVAGVIACLDVRNDSTPLRSEDISGEQATIHIVVL